MRTIIAAATLLTIAQGDDAWAGCESFPGFGSAVDNVRFSIGEDTGSFNITTIDFLGSRSCHGFGDLTWGHHGTYTCGETGEVQFERQGVWIEAHTVGGLLFGKVLCPHISLKKAERAEISLGDLASKCASVTFNNCATFYDTLASNVSANELHRSSAPSCKSDPTRKANGPPLLCRGPTCQAPCKHMLPPQRPNPTDVALGSCGKQCKADADCSGCGSSGRCKGADQVTKICVDAPSSVPETPAAAATGIDWPNSWAADMFTLTYNDFSDKTKTQGGRFYYDFARGRQLQDFGKTSLLYITGAKGQPSKFYFKAFGLACFYVETTDPGTKEAIGIPRPNFMQACANMHAASYVGREKVLGEWADHYTCSVNMDNQTIAFQSWHSLGLGTDSFGLPLALSAGDSKPTWQAPRLTTTWYSNVTTGPEAVPNSMFAPPKFCVRIPGQEAETRLGLGSESFLASFGDYDVRERALKVLKDFTPAPKTQLVV
eukprot:TRINITY_DN15570_c0_g1_i1.p1 TRINITY_DN15570_c0_g1~~TRINITY_DN15570_c0_g1_i1.p1  ORF type:complete len:488 (+),score=61.35 TRINITY_DN15570_c0_g1_i1:104-1567(+)